jgi:uncharacterized protein
MGARGHVVNILISGSSGLVGTALTAHFAAGGNRVLRLVRPPARRARSTRLAPDVGRATAGGAGAASPTLTIAWDPAARRIDPSLLEDMDAAVHLSGESLAAGRWTAARKERIRSSRIESTAFLAGTLAKLARPPRAFISASAVGYYGNRGDDLLDEACPAGPDFLAQVCRDWETAAESAASGRVRVVTLRTGLVLSPSGGALAAMLPLFRMGLGGPLGNGRQWMSWIALDDLVGAVEHSIATEGLQGALNTVAPTPVMNSEFARCLGRVLGRPALLRVPALALKVALGELSEALLGSQRAVPRRLLESGFRFRHPRLEDALRHALGRSATRSASPT